MFFGQPSPDASTGMSSYLLKLMPVLAPPNRFLRDTGVKGQGSRGQGKDENRGYLYWSAILSCIYMYEFDLAIKFWSAILQKKASGHLCSARGQSECQHQNYSTM